ncbi:hypothetical protein PR048_032089 [Dryococelus australis]|uniref:Uncharacterized protein n=1 Tax=Dryococelus australis TaxID=614101 RepID=A0ABQ9G412_9NEOP|nr:hypothetical protein PR048_032089 [Dryococelus australis]
MCSTCLPTAAKGKVIYTLHSSSFPHPLHGHLLPHWACVLPPFQQRREGNLHFTLIFFSSSPAWASPSSLGMCSTSLPTAARRLIYTLHSSLSSSPAWASPSSLGMCSTSFHSGEKKGNLHFTLIFFSSSPAWASPSSLGMCSTSLPTAARSGEKVIYTLLSSSSSSLHGHLLPHWACVLPAFQQRREVNLHFTLILSSSLHGHLLPHWACVLPPFQQRREGKVIYTLHSSSFPHPCMGISFLTGHVFYLPSNSARKGNLHFTSSSSSSPAWHLLPHWACVLPAFHSGEKVDLHFTLIFFSSSPAWASPSSLGMCSTSLPTAARR